MGKYDLSDRETAVPEPDAAAPGGKYDLRSEPTVMPPSTAPGRTWWDTAKGVGQTAVDFATAAGSSGTFGMDVRRDALAGWIAGDYPSYSEGVAAEQKRLEKQRERSPIASIAGDVAGGVAMPGLGGSALAARGIQAGLRPILARGVGYGVEGAGLGAAQGAGTTYSGVPSDYVKNAITSGAIGGAAGGVLGGIFGPRNPGRRSTAETPSTDRLYTEKQSNYRDLANQPQMYEPHAVSFRGDDIDTQLRSAPNLFEPGTAPVSFRGVGHLHDPPTQAHLGRGAPVSPGDLEAIIQGINKNVVQGSPDAAASGIVKRGINDFILNPPPGAVLPGMQAQAAEATALANRARGNYAGYRRGEMFDDLMDNALTSAGGAASGLNLQNRLRQGIGGAVKRTKGESRASKAGLNDAEIQAMTDFARVSPGDQALRYVDRIMGGGGGLGALSATAAGITGGGAAGYVQENPWVGATLGAGVLPAGLALRAFGNRRAHRQMAELGDLVRQRTPLYQERAAIAPTVGPGKTGSQMLRDAITTGLIDSGFGQVDSVEDEPLRITVNPKR